MAFRTPPASASWRTAAASTATALLLGATSCAGQATAAQEEPGAGERLFPALGTTGYDATAYDVSYDYRPDATTMTSSVLVTAVAQQQLTEFSLDAAAREVSAVVVDGHPAGFRLLPGTEKLVVTPEHPLPPGRTFTTRVDFTADRAANPPSPALDLPAGTDWPWQSWIETPDGFALMGQPDRAHLFFPCNDVPGDKARTTFRVTAPSDLQVVANGTLVSEAPEGPGTRTVTYRTDDDIPTHVVQVAVGRFRPVAQEGPRGLPITSWIPADRPELAASADDTAEQLQWVESALGVEYPFDSYGVLAVDSDYNGVALETATLSTLSAAELGLPGDQEAPTMVHELVHQWFGNAVSVRTWDDMWLSEGHATYYQWLWASEHGGQDLDATMREVYAADAAQRQQSGPPGRLTSSLGVLFDTNAPGALTLYGLRELVGPDVFARIEQAFFAEHRGRSASTADFTRVASEVAGRDLQPYVDSWVYGSTTPPMPGHPDWTSELP
ncbi:M1 family metallopeptidase [Quadrisphaera sp. DSM 44207]|uniref:M1 family metallopeptidase n=1 Tax=Quadrisphaera sp. DSM 44207 TaxID=1881057 RepID=UPI00088B7975|nr:M1 family metallopeptidase [Quadrisphaera sp. DSM 44207]SDQ86623.1 Peptidase family M1 [Quadrisphaera sp. DSM 44207]